MSAKIVSSPTTIGVKLLMFATTLLWFIPSTECRAQLELFEAAGELQDISPRTASILERISRSKGTIAGSRQIVKLSDKVSVADTNSTFNITLPKGEKLAYACRVVDQFQDNAIRATKLFGKAEERFEATYLDVVNSSVTGLIYSGGKVYAVEPIGGGLQAVTELDMSKYDQHDHNNQFERIERLAVNAGNLQADAPNLPPTEITVLVCYTPKVTSLQANVLSLINSAVTLANSSYSNSKVNAKLKLVGSHEVTYVESATHQVDLDRFRIKGDGVMDEIHSLRDQWKADICVLLIDNDQYCGLAAAILASADTAFAVVHHDCAVKNLSFPHEIGHLQGARHDLGADPTIDTANPFNHGFISPGTMNWRTIMSYPKPGKPVRLPQWSNPDVKIEGVPSGAVGTEDNAKMLNLTAKQLSLFK